MQFLRFKFSALALLLANSIYSQQQVAIPGDIERIEKGQDTTALNLYQSTPVSVSGPVSILDPFLKASYNTTYQRGFNDGPVWKGKGLTTELHGGLSGNKGKFSYTIHPVVFVSQNNAYYSSRSTAANYVDSRYPFNPRIDWVQRYGEGQLVAFHPGQSEVRYTKGSFFTSLSTQNYSLGPSVYNPIIISRQGNGFPHVRLGTHPFDISIKKNSIGKFEINFLAGLLQESDYFDSFSANDSRYFNALSVAYQPSFLDELTISFNRALYKQTRFFEPWDVISVLGILDDGEVGDTISTNDTFDQVASITAQWKIEESGFRVYVEYAKNDFAGRFQRLLLEPEHTRAYTIGLEKRVYTKKGKEVIMHYEHTNLSRNADFLFQFEPTYYTHHINTQGYTHRGQLIGAGIGPGGNSDHAEVRIKTDQSLMGFLLRRVEYDRDYYYLQVRDRLLRNIEYSAGFQLLRHYKSWSFGMECILSYNYNHFFEEDKVNAYLSFSSRIRLNDK